MIKNILLIAFIIASLIVSSCSNHILFTKEIRNNLYENQLNVENVQFYNSERIILVRNLSKEETQIAKGTIRFEDGKYYEEIIIPKKTKGVVVRRGSKFLKIAFEEGINKNLRFDMNDNDLYQISADSWKNNYGCISYDTTIYYIIPASSKTVLLVSKEYIMNFEKNRRVLKGVSVGR